MEQLIEEVTRGNVTEVKVALATVILVLAVYQLLLAAVATGDPAARLGARRAGDRRGRDRRRHAHLGPTSTAELEVREDIVKERQELREQRAEEREERLEE